MGRVRGVVFSKVASAQNGDPEQAQVTRRDAHPLASAAVFIDRTPDDLEGRAIFDIDGPPKAGGRKFHSREGIEPVAAIPQELSHAGCVLVALAVERHLHGENIVRIEAGTHLVEGDEGANEKRRADEQDQGQRDFADDQQRAGLPLAESSARAVAALFQRRVQIGVRRGERREQAEENAGEQRDGEGEAEHAPIQADGRAVLADAGQACGTDGEQCSHAYKAESHAENAAGQGEQHTFSEQLAHDARAAGSQCGAYGELTFAAGGAHQQQIGDIGAGDQQHQCYRAQHHQQRIARVADDAVAQWSNRKIRSPIRVRELTVVLRACREQFCVGLRDGDARLEQSGGLKEDVPVVAGRVKLKRQPEVSLRVGDEIRSDDADDGVRLIAQRD